MELQVLNTSQTSSNVGWHLTFSFWLSLCVSPFLWFGPAIALPPSSVDTRRQLFKLPPPEIKRCEMWEVVSVLIFGLSTFPL